MEQMITIPYVAHEGDMAREERKQRRLWILMLAETVVIGVFICLNHLSQQKQNR